MSSNLDGTSLPPRSLCSAADCDCAGWYQQQPDGTLVSQPGQAKDLCLCGHPWWQHKGEEWFKGGHSGTGCGGFVFLPTTDEPRPSHRTLCAGCQKPFMGHHNLAVPGQISVPPPSSATQVHSGHAGAGSFAPLRPASRNIMGFGFDSGPGSVSSQRPLPQSQQVHPSRPTPRPPSTNQAQTVPPAQQQTSAPHPLLPPGLPHPPLGYSHQQTTASNQWGSQQTPRGTQHLPPPPPIFQHWGGLNGLNVGADPPQPSQWGHHPHAPPSLFRGPSNNTNPPSSSAHANATRPMQPFFPPATSSRFQPSSTVRTIVHHDRTSSAQAHNPNARIRKPPFDLPPGSLDAPAGSFSGIAEAILRHIYDVLVVPFSFNPRVNSEEDGAEGPSRVYWSQADIAALYRILEENNLVFSYETPASGPGSYDPGDFMIAANNALHHGRIGVPIGRAFQVMHGVHTFAESPIPPYGPPPMSFVDWPFSFIGKPLRGGGRTKKTTSADVTLSLQHPHPSLFNEKHLSSLMPFLHPRDPNRRLLIIAPQTRNLQAMIGGVHCPCFAWHVCRDFNFSSPPDGAEPYILNGREEWCFPECPLRPRTPSPSPPLAIPNRATTRRMLRRRRDEVNDVDVEDDIEHPRTRQRIRERSPLFARPAPVSFPDSDSDTSMSDDDNEDLFGRNIFQHIEDPMFERTNDSLLLAPSPPSAFNDNDSENDHNDLVVLSPALQPSGTILHPGQRSLLRHDLGPVFLDRLEEAQDIDAWVTNVRNSIPGRLKAISINCKTSFEDGVSVFLRLVRHTHESPATVFALDDATKSKVDLRLPSTPIRTCHLLLSRALTTQYGRAFGPGVLKTFMQETLNEVFSPERLVWTPASVGDKCFVPNLTPLNQNPGPAADTFRTEGSIMALFIALMGIPPEGLHPMTLYIALSSLHKISLGGSANTSADDVDPIKHLRPVDIEPFDPVVARLVRDFESVAPHQILPPNHDLVIRVQCAFDVQENYFARPRSAEQDEDMRIMLLSKLFTGSTHPYSHAGFLAFVDGLHITLDDSSNPPLRLFDQTVMNGLPPLGMVQGLYSVGVRGVRNLLQRIKFDTAYPPDDEEGILFSTLLMLHFVRWLCGKGHPKSLMQEGVVSESIYKKEKDNVLTRALLFVQTVTGYETLRIPNHIEMKISVRRPTTIDINALNPDEHAIGKFHVCSSTLEVILNSAMKEMLLDAHSFDDPEYVSAVDCWLHKSMLEVEAEKRIAERQTRHDHYTIV